MIQSLQIEIAGRKVAYFHKSSDKRVATVIFIHGFPFSSGMWKSQLDALPENIEGIAYDIRGFGRSEAKHHFFSIDLFSQDFIEFTDRLSLSEVVICGLSMGGYIALRIAQISLEKVRGLILADTHALADTNEGKTNRFKNIEQLLNGKKAEFASGFLKNIFAESTFQGYPSVIKFIEDIILNTSDETICAALLALASRTDTSEVLRKIEVPALILRGAEDKVMTEAHASQLSDNLKFSEFHTISDSGHLPNLENTPEFNRILNNFLLKHF